MSTANDAARSPPSHHWTQEHVPKGPSCARVPPQILAAISLGSRPCMFYPGGRFGRQFPESCISSTRGQSHTPARVSASLSLPPPGLSGDNEVRDATEPAWAPHVCHENRRRPALCGVALRLMMMATSGEWVSLQRTEPRCSRSSCLLPRLPRLTPSSSTPVFISVTHPHTAVLLKACVLGSQAMPPTN